MMVTRGSDAARTRPVISINFVPNEAYAVVQRRRWRQRTSSMRSRRRARRRKRPAKKRDDLLPALEARLEQDRSAERTEPDLAVDCPICFDHRRNTVLGCGHSLCVTCTLRILREPEAGRGACPECREPIASTSKFIPP